MDTYKPEKTGLELAGGRLTKRDKHGAIEASRSKWPYRMDTGAGMDWDRGKLKPHDP